MTTENTFHTVSAHSAMPHENFCSLILDNVQESFILIDPELKLAYFNKAARDGIYRFLNVEIKKGMNVMQLVRPDRRQLLQSAYQEVLKGRAFATENNFTLANGETIFFENSFLPAYDEQQRITGIIVKSSNITEQKKAREIIKESEARLQFALEATHQGAWDWNLKTDEMIFSSSYKKLYGFAENELKYNVREWISRIHPDDQKKMRNAVQKHLKSPNPVLVSRYRIRAKNGSYRWVLAKGQLIRDAATGEAIRMIGTHTDITESMEKERALKQYHERLDCIMKASNDMLWEWDLETGKVVRSEDGLKKVFGMADNSKIEAIDDWLQHVHPDDRHRAVDKIKEILEAKHQQTFELEYRFRRDDGEYNYIYDRGVLMTGTDNKPVRVIGSAQDISERKRLEQEILQNELAYQRLIHQATIESQEKERAEIGKELHDNVNQVLTTTKLYLDLAQTNDELRDDLVRKSVKNINGVIQEIRHLSRSLMDPSIGDLGLLYSLNDLIDNVHTTKKLNVELVADESIEAVLDAKQKLALFRIIQESLSNSLRHANASLVRIKMEVKDGQFYMDFSDNGIGIQKETIKKGAGLKNIQNRIYLINGTLQIDSKPNEGFQMHIQFPIR